MTNNPRDKSGQDVDVFGKKGEPFILWAKNMNLLDPWTQKRNFRPRDKNMKFLEHGTKA